MAHKEAAIKRHRQGSRETSGMDVEGDGCLEERPNPGEFPIVYTIRVGEIPVPVQLENGSDQRTEFLKMNDTLYVQSIQAILSGCLTSSEQQWQQLQPTAPTPRTQRSRFT